VGQAGAYNPVDLLFKVHVGFLTSELIAEVGRVDVVLLAEVLEHVAAPHGLLVKSREALRPGGSVIVSVPNIAHWSIRANLLRGHFDYQDHGCDAHAVVLTCSPKFSSAKT